MTQFIKLFTLLFIMQVSASLYAEHSQSLKMLASAYPHEIRQVSAHSILCHDGTRIPIEPSSSFNNWWHHLFYRYNTTYGIISAQNILHDIYEPLFRKMYGNSAQEVRQHLVTIYWMPHVFGKRYPIKVTSVNGVDKQLTLVSQELEKLPPKFYKYLDKPGSGFYWRPVAGEEYLSLHSFGIAIDINLQYSNYWLWDFYKLKKPLSELKNHQVKYQNRIPMEIVNVFQRHGFYWGGNWYLYDTMHFEYRPELLF